jgi:peptidoglycan/LPS O-acetylase OafA/YrhL
VIVSQIVSEEVLVSSPTSERFYRSELDVLRFGAFFMVFLSHWIPLKNDSSHALIALRMCFAFGVSVFFALSSYLITELLQREKRQTGSLNLRAFYIRRIVRIWPLYFGVLFVGFFVSRCNHGTSMTVESLLAYVFLIGNMYTVFHGWLPSILAPLWSIGVEEQFYLVWPWITRTRFLLAACFLTILISQIAILVMCNRHVPVAPTIWCNTFTHVQYFGIGGAISLLLKGKGLRLKPITRGIMIATGLVLFYLANQIFNANPTGDAVASLSRTYPGYLIASIGVVLILLAAIGAAVPSSAGPLVYFGKISYGLYVYHVLGLELAGWSVASILHLNHFRAPITFVGGLGLTLLVASLSYKYFESPFLRYKKRFEVVHSRPI